MALCGLRGGRRWDDIMPSLGRETRQELGRATGPEIVRKVETPVCPSSCASITSAWLRPSPCPGRFAGVVDITVLYRISPSQR